MYLTCRECDTISCFRPASTIVDLAAPRTHCCFHNGTISTSIDLGEYRLRSRTTKTPKSDNPISVDVKPLSHQIEKSNITLGSNLESTSGVICTPSFSGADSNMNPPLLNPFSLTLWHCGFPRLDKGCLWWKYYMNYSLRSCMQQRFIVWDCWCKECWSKCLV